MQLKDLQLNQLEALNISQDIALLNVLIDAELSTLRARLSLTPNLLDHVERRLLSEINALEFVRNLPGRALREKLLEESH